MASSNRANKAIVKAKDRALAKSSASWRKKTAANDSRFKDTGTSGAAEKKKRQTKIDKKTNATSKSISKKSNTDFANVTRYGKEAMKSRGFATMPNTKAKKKPAAKKKVKK